MKQNSSTRFWTDKERKILQRMYADNYTETVSRKIDRSCSSIYGQAKVMGLKKSESFIKMELGKQADRLRIVGVKSRYPKGRTPENKGKQMSADLYKKCAGTMFKKGQLPHNTKADFTVTLRVDKRGVTYQFIRVSLGKWEPLHRFVWQMINGDIPPKMKLIFIDGNTMNCNIENLRLVTCAELMRLNSYHNNYPKELALAIQLSGALIRQINKHLKKLQNEK